MIKLLLNILIRAIKVGIKLDSGILKDFNCLPENYIIKINILPNNQNICVMRLSDSISIIEQEPTKIDLIVEFKDETSAKNCLLGKVSLASLFCEHRIIITGNLNNAMALTRMVNTIECYLYPKAVCSKLFTPLPQLETSKFKFYTTLLFGGNL